MWGTFLIHSLSLSSPPSFDLLLPHVLETKTVGTVIRTDGLTMKEWAEQEIAAGRGGMIGMSSSSNGGNGGSAILREWERRRLESEK